MNTIVVAYDETEPAQRALERAAGLGRALGARLVVTSVAAVATPAGGRSIGIDPTESADAHRDELAQARGYLDGEGVAADYVEAVGHRSEAILEVARSRGADLIVIGSRDLSALQRLLGQSVSDAVAHHARCDVLIVH